MKKNTNKNESKTEEKNQKNQPKRGEKGGKLSPPPNFTAADGSELTSKNIGVKRK